jgi:TldD protein
VRDHSLREEIRRLIDVIEAESKLPVKPVDVGRYDAVLDAPSMQQLVAGTLGRATELDRALGYEANAGGTTYITDPFGSLGKIQVGASALTLLADRSTPGGAATVQWDDEGVAPDDFTLVKDGVLTDFQTMRESAGWLKDSYATLGRPWRSHGCANAPSAIAPPLQHTPNLLVVPGPEPLDFDALLSGSSQGLAIEEARADMDFQAATGLGSGRMYKVERGKKVALLAGAGFLFRATEFWKSVRALGGDAGLRRYGLLTDKGEPAQGCYYSVTAPPAAVRQLALIDVLRKA